MNWIYDCQAKCAMKLIAIAFSLLCVLNAHAQSDVRILVVGGSLADNLHNELRDITGYKTYGLVRHGDDSCQRLNDTRTRNLMSNSQYAAVIWIPNHAELFNVEFRDCAKELAKLVPNRLIVVTPNPRHRTHKIYSDQDGGFINYKNNWYKYGDNPIDYARRYEWRASQVAASSDQGMLVDWASDVAHNQGTPDRLYSYDRFHTSMIGTRELASFIVLQANL